LIHPPLTPPIKGGNNNPTHPSLILGEDGWGYMPSLLVGEGKGEGYANLIFIFVLILLLLERIHNGKKGIPG
jgi:hypothetical protein